MKLLCYLSLLIFLSITSSFAQPITPPAMQDTSGLGANISRSMNLLASSTPTQRNTVKIMVYGQSITDQEWSDSLKDFLKAKYPYANSIIINRAISGYETKKLKQSVTIDVVPFYPDLIIFHDLGSHYFLDSIIHIIRKKTVAEILLLNTHVTCANDAEDSWEHIYGYTHIPNIARKFGLEFCDIRTAWYKYLAENDITDPDTFTSDGLHLNKKGISLMYKLVMPYLFYNEKFPVDPMQTVITYQVGKDIKWNNGQLKLPFTGNKLEIISGDPTPSIDSATITIDDKKPSSFFESVQFTRPFSGYSHNWRVVSFWNTLGMVNIRNHAPLLEEDWALTITGLTSTGNNLQMHFSIAGSKTGSDGSGSISLVAENGFNAVATGDIFISNSKKVVIYPNDWFAYIYADKGKKIPYKVGYIIPFKAKRFYTDIYKPSTKINKNIDSATTVIQGISNTSHTLVIVATGKKSVPIKAIRVYRPPIDRGEENKVIMTAPLLSTTRSFYVVTGDGLNIPSLVKDQNYAPGTFVFANNDTLLQRVQNPFSVSATGTYFISKSNLNGKESRISIHIAGKDCKPTLPTSEVKIKIDSVTDLYKVALNIWSVPGIIKFFSTNKPDTELLNPSTAPSGEYLIQFRTCSIPSKAQSDLLRNYNFSKFNKHKNKCAQQNGKSDKKKDQIHPNNNKKDE